MGNSMEHDSRHSSGLVVCVFLPNTVHKLFTVTNLARTWAPLPQYLVSAFQGLKLNLRQLPCR